MSLICAQAAPVPASVLSLADMNIEDLANIEITSVSKHAEKLSEAAASLYVITHEDLQRSSATSLPEALRLAPNLQVARIDARNYAVTARGFNDAFANKLLVLIDGRTVYSPLFSGVFWDAQDVVLEDVDRIEVISGPGATLWGANAVNGVINIITRSAQDSQGGLLSASASRRQNAWAGRYGGKLSDDGAYRIYGKHAEQDNTFKANAGELQDGMRRDQFGFRADWNSAGDKLKLQGDTYRGSLKQNLTPDISTSGANLLGRWDKQLSATASLYLQMYYDRTTRDQANAYKDTLDTLDVELQHSSQAAEQHKLTWGLGYRFERDRNSPTTKGFAFLPGNLDTRLSNLFLQDEITLAQALRLTLGAKIEHNDYTGRETLPSARLAWTPSAGHLLWGELSRAVRAPSRIDSDFYVPATAPYIIGGGPHFVSEVTDVFELGYKGRLLSSASYSITAFYNRYHSLRSGEPNPAQPGSFAIANKIAGNSRGIEMWGNWQILSSWRLSGGLVGQTRHLQSEGSVDKTTLTTDKDPGSYWSLRSQFDLSDARTLDLSVRRVGALENPAVPAYYAVDAHFGWKLRPNLSLSLIGLNLFDGGHPEFGAAPARSEQAREVLLKMVYQF